MSSLKLSDPSQEKSFSVSKWIKHQVLVDGDEMELLCRELAPLYLYNVSEIVSLTELEVTIPHFLESYRRYLRELLAGVTTFDPVIRRSMATAMTNTERALYACHISNERYMAKPRFPVVQLQQHRFFISKATGTFQPMVMSPESIHWGLQFSYPQIFHDGATYGKVSNSDQFPNTALFTTLVRWLRNATVPTTFLWEGKKIATPMRLGKNCFSWINNHPQLIQQGVTVHAY